jgi:CubicO group peptidase (beta-lactamase class C family)
LDHSIDRIAAETGFSGVVCVDRGGEVELAKAYGLAHRGWGIANTIDTRFGIASGAKGLTALTVMSLIEEGRLELGTTAGSVLGNDLSLIHEALTVEHLLAHRSDIGDYLDEEIERDPIDYVLPISAHQLGSTEEYLRVLGGLETKFPPDERFSYSNGGYVVLALIAERSSGTPFHELVVQRVCEPAGMVDTEFLRSDELPGRAALGYLAEDGPRTNVFHLPVRGSGERWHLLNGGGRQRPVDRLVRRTHRLEGPARRDGATPERGAVADATCAVRHGDLAPPLPRPGGATWIGRGRVIPDRSRPERTLHLHGPVEHDRWRVADRPASRRALPLVSPGSVTAVEGEVSRVAAG